MKLSIIIPYYKNIYTIDATLRSLRSALNRCDSLSVELVAVDNNSSDGTKNKIEEFAHPKVCVVHVEEKNQGVSSARNAGISASSGDYVAFLDADDEIEPDYFSDVARGLKLHPDIVFVKHEAFARKQSWKPLSASLLLKSHLKGWWNCQFLFKKSLASGLEFQGSCFEDFGFFPRILARAQECIILERGLYHYKDNPASVTKRAIDWRISELQAQFDALRSSSNELGVDVYKRVQIDFYQHMSLLRAISGRFPVLGMRESLTLMVLAESWRARLECILRLFRLNGSIVFRSIKRLIRRVSR